MACRICRADPEIRDQIEKALLQERKVRDVAREFLAFFDCNLHLLEQSLSTHFKRHRDRHLTLKDLELLERVEKREVSDTEIYNWIAVRAFENLFRNPDKVKMSDWLRIEALKIKKAKLSSRDDWASKALSTFFGGYIPPKNCPKCGTQLLNSWQPNPNS